MKLLCPKCSASIVSDAPAPETVGEIRQLACPACGCLFQPAATESGSSVTVVPGRWRNLNSLHRNLLLFGSAALITLGALGFFLASKRPGNTHLNETKTSHRVLQNEYFRRLVAEGRVTEDDLAGITGPLPLDDGFTAVTTEKMTWQMAGQLASRLNARILPIDSVSGRDAQDIGSFLEQSFPNFKGSTLWISARQAPFIIDLPDHAPATDLECKRHVVLFWSKGADSENDGAAR